MNQDTYFEWLCDIVCDRMHKKRYHSLLKLLFETDFIFINKMDRNRAVDGEDLRYRFEGTTGQLVFDGSFEQQCSVLEMMVALSMRIQSTYMDNPIDDDQTSKWFWDMIFNLGLLNMDERRFDYDKSYAILMRFLTCRYAENGEGGLFTLHDTDIPVYEMEIWTQADYWVDQNF